MRIKIGQASLEMTVALIIVVILIVAGVKMFVWLNLGLVGRQTAYDDTRVQAGSTSMTNLMSGSLSSTVAGSHVSEDALVLQDITGQNEVGFLNESLNADLNLVVKF